jgi:hypothetical protein
MVSLVQDKRLFGTLAKQADTIEAAGNALARDVNRARAEGAAALGDLLARLAQRTGPVSDALNRAAERVAAGQRKGAATNEFLDEVRTLLDRDGLQALLGPGELRPRAVSEPGTPEALASAEAANAQRATVARETDVAGTPEPGEVKTAPRTPEGQQAASEPEIITPQQQAVNDEVRETLAAAYMDAMPGQSIMRVAMREVRDLIEGGDTHAPNGAAWSDVLAELERRRPITPDMTINAAGDIVPRAPDAEPSLFDAVAVAARPDGNDTRLMSREAALAEADKPALYGDLIEACKL